MSTAYLPATVLQLVSHGSHLQLQLAVRGGEQVVVTIPVSGGNGVALPHIHALHGHSAHCEGRIDVHVDLLLRCCRVLGSTRQRLIVRATGAPAFWLQVQTPGDELVHLDIGVLDALVLLSSRRIPVGVEAWTVDTGSVQAVAGQDQLDDVALDGSALHDWDRALRRLLEG